MISGQPIPYPCLIVENPVTDTVGTYPTLIARNNADRVQIIVINVGTRDIYIGFSPRVSSSRGFWIAAQGGVFQMKYFEDGEAVFHELYAVSPGGPDTIYVIEFVRR